MAYSRRDYAGGAPATTLTETINSGATSITIASAAGWPAGSNGAFVAVIDRGLASEEKILVGSRISTTLTVTTRGYDGTTATSHSSGAAIEHCISAVDMDEANYAVSQTVGQVSAAGDLLVGSAANTLTRLAKGSASKVLGVDSGGTLGYTTVTSAMITDATIGSGDLADNAVSTAKIEDGAVTADKVATGVAGNGLAGGAGTALSVNVDNSTLAIATDTVKVKDAGVTGTQLAASVAGNGLTGGAGSALAVGAGTGISVTSDAVAVDSTLIGPLGAWTTYTPSLTQGSALTKTVNAGAYMRIGRLIHATFDLSITSAGTSGNPILVGLPVAMDSTLNVVGGWLRYDDASKSPADPMIGIPWTSTTSTVGMLSGAYDGDATRLVDFLGYTATVAASGDRIYGFLTYCAAS